MSRPGLSIVVPLYRSEGSIDDLVDRLKALDVDLGAGLLEVVFVDDGSPDRAVSALEAHMPLQFRSMVIRHSRNFGSFAAVKTGLAAARGEFVGVMAADLQEPPELLLQMREALLVEDADVAYGVRSGRSSDPLLSRSSSKAFWWLYRRIAQPAMPAGGIDIFLARSNVIEALLALREANSSLVGSLVWLGFPAVEVPYERAPRVDGARSAWSLRRRIAYMADSVFSFSRLPLAILGWTGGVGLALCLVAGTITLVGRLSGQIELAGYTPIMLAVFTCTSLILIALWIVGEFAWRTYENSKQRPTAVVRAAPSSLETVRHRETGRPPCDEHAPPGGSS